MPTPLILLIGLAMAAAACAARQALREMEQIDDQGDPIEKDEQP